VLVTADEIGNVMSSYIPRPNCEAGDDPPIVTHVCSLRFPDGKTATAQIKVSSPYQECPVVYSGAAERLPIRNGIADTVLLRVLFLSFARELRAKFEEKLIGSWNRFTDEDGANTP
jgi:hypothetical protein